MSDMLWILPYFKCGTCVCVVIGLEDVKDVVDPQSTVTAGLVSASDTSVPLTSVHVRAQLVDLAAQVNISEWLIFI